MTAATLARTGSELRRAAGEARAAWNRAAWLAVGVIALAALVPLLSLPGVRLDALAQTVYLGAAATALGLTVGAAGLPSLGAGAFMAIGAFTAALLVARSGWSVESAALCGAAAALAAALICGGVVRLRPVFVAVSTWLLAWLVWIFLLAFPSVSGGSQGLTLPQRTLLGLVPTPTVHYEIALALLVLTAVGIAAVRSGAPGLELSALRQAPPLATSLGVPLVRRRLGAFAVSAAIAGLAGALSVQLAAVADPASYDPFLSFKLLVAVLLGGAASTLGPAVGVAVLGAIGLASGPLARLLQLPLERFDAAVAAVLLVFVLALGGGGIVPWLLRLFHRPRRKTGQVTVCYSSHHEPSPGPVLGAVGLRKAFGGVVAVDGVSLELRPGEVTALIGPNGSGKTTALRLISGAIAPDAGQVLAAGRDVTSAPTAERVSLGVVRTLQTTSAFTELTALENVLVGRSVRRRYGGLLRTAVATPRVRAEAAEAQSAALDALSLVDLDRHAHTPAPELTGSQRRLLALAAALATEPRVMLVDELAAGAAPDELERLAEIAARIRQRGIALLLVEHNLRLVRLAADRVIVLAAGTPIAAGSVEEVRESDAVRRAYLGAQRL